MTDYERIDRVCKRANEIVSKKIIISKSDREVLLELIKSYEKVTKMWLEVKPCVKE